MFRFHLNAVTHSKSVPQAVEDVAWRVLASTPNNNARSTGLDNLEAAASVAGVLLWWWCYWLGVFATARPGCVSEDGLKRKWTTCSDNLQGVSERAVGVGVSRIDNFECQAVNQLVTHQTYACLWRARKKIQSTQGARNNTKVPLGAAAMQAAGAWRGGEGFKGSSLAQVVNQTKVTKDFDKRLGLQCLMIADCPLV